jgi:hypothetical protein
MGMFYPYARRGINIPANQTKPVGLIVPPCPCFAQKNIYDSLVLGGVILLSNNFTEDERR